VSGFLVLERNRNTRETWLTPRALLASLGVKFDLDPCAAPSPRPWPTAKRHIELPTNGLAAPWSGRIWLNPPYGKQAGLWLKRLADHGNGIALVFARTETAMFHEQVWPRASAVLFLRGRVSFCDADGRPADRSVSPSVLVAYGADNAEKLSRCGLEGAFLPITPATRASGRQADLALSSPIGGHQ